VFPRPLAHALRIEIRKYIQPRIQPLNLRDVRLSQLNDGNLAGAQQLQLP
jgi:hypothetical protein